MVKSDIEALAGKSDLASVCKTSNLASVCKTSELSNLVVKSDIITLIGKSDIEALAGKSDLASVCKTSELSDLVVKSDIAKLAEKSDIDDLFDALPEKSDIAKLAEKTDLDELANKSDIFDGLSSYKVAKISDIKIEINDLEIDDVFFSNIEQVLRKVLNEIPLICGASLSSKDLVLITKLALSQIDEQSGSGCDTKYINQLFQNMEKNLTQTIKYEVQNSIDEYFSLINKKLNLIGTTLHILDPGCFD